MSEASNRQFEPACVDLQTTPADGPRISFAGHWVTGNPLPAVEPLIEKLGSQKGQSLAFETAAILGWDSRFITWVLKLTKAVETQGLTVRRDGLPEGVQELIKLATAVPERTGARRTQESAGLLTRIGVQVYAFLAQSRLFLSFLGEVFIASLRLVRGKARFRRSDLLQFIQETGAEALPIVSLISILVGFILAFVGAVQLAMFGAQIYVANLVGIAMAREMGAMMTAIIMAGRTGAAFSAQLGTMQVNEEIDAFKTLGVSPIEFLVLPRMLALILMMPLLTIYSDLLGIFGGFLVGITLFDISFSQYWEQTRAAVSLTDLGVGLVKSMVFAILIAVSGCMKGIQCGRSSAAVGEATTSAVVMSIVAIVVMDAIMTLIANSLGV